MPELLALPDQVSVIVVDDASPDGTGAAVPIQFYDRTAGQSKVSRAEIGRAMYTVLRLAGRRD